MTASVRPESSGKNYNYSVKIFMDWCANLSPPVDPFTAPITTVANFLAWVHSSRDLGQSAVASFRSAISKVHIGYNGIPIGKSGAISNLIKGIGNLDPIRRSRRPRYTDTWDLAPVLDALACMHPPQSLSLMELSIKTLALVALATISRASTLFLLSRDFSYSHNEEEDVLSQLFIKFIPGSREKTDTGRLGLFIPALSEEESLDPVLYLAAYRDRSSQGGVFTQGEENSLWLSTKKPHPPVKTVTLASWLKKAMEKGGVDTGIYKAHTIRAAVPAHLRKTKSLSLVQILARGGWKASSDGKSRTFIKFYERTAHS